MEFFSIYFLSILGFGFLLGLKHALDTDHFVAVSTIISKNKNLKKSLILGISWGIGHTTTLFFVGLLILIFKINISERIALGFEFIVGIVLIFLGLEILYNRLISKNKMKYFIKNDKSNYNYKHSSKKQLSHNHKSFLIGLIHGLAGSAVLMLLVTASINSITQGLIFILIFGIGSIFGMFLISGIISTQLIFLSKINKLDKILEIIAGIISIIIGVIIIIKLF